jgi:hypothetical protein
MTAADRIFAYIKQHGRATRPEMEAALDLCERTIDSGIRKLERLGYIERSGVTPKEFRKTPAIIFALAGTSVDLRLIRDCRGRPRLTEPVVTHKHSFDALTSAMSNFFQREAA